jgi:hypothetical protein
VPTLRRSRSQFVIPRLCARFLDPGHFDNDNEYAYEYGTR